YGCGYSVICSCGGTYGGGPCWMYNGTCTTGGTYFWGWLLCSLLPTSASANPNLALSLRAQPCKPYSVDYAYIYGIYDCLR
ncbi:hypothetical protein KI387_024146, partial [Taxus chinensis]